MLEAPTTWKPITSTIFYPLRLKPTHAATCNCDQCCPCWQCRENRRGTGVKDG